MDHQTDHVRILTEKVGSLEKKIEGLKNELAGCHDQLAKQKNEFDISINHATQAMDNMQRMVNQRLSALIEKIDLSRMNHSGQSMPNAMFQKDMSGGALFQSQPHNRDPYQSYHQYSGYHDFHHSPQPQYNVGNPSKDDPYSRTAGFYNSPYQQNPPDPRFNNMNASSLGGGTPRGHYQQHHVGDGRFGDSRSESSSRGDGGRQQSRHPAHFSSSHSYDSQIPNFSNQASPPLQQQDYHDQQQQKHLNGSTATAAEQYHSSNNPTNQLPPQQFHSGQSNGNLTPRNTVQGGGERSDQK